MKHEFFAWFWVDISIELVPLIAISFCRMFLYIKRNEFTLTLIDYLLLWYSISLINHSSPPISFFADFLSRILPSSVFSIPYLEAWGVQAPNPLSLLISTKKQRSKTDPEGTSPDPAPIASKINHRAKHHVYYRVWNLLSPSDSFVTAVLNWAFWT